MRQLIFYDDISIDRGLDRDREDERERKKREKERERVGGKGQKVCNYLFSRGKDLFNIHTFSFRFTTDSLCVCEVA